MVGFFYLIQAEQTRGCSYEGSRVDMENTKNQTETLKHGVYGEKVPFTAEKSAFLGLKIGLRAERSPFQRPYFLFRIQAQITQEI